VCLVSTNRERAVRAAIELLGTEGVRSLTHGRVDERAGLPRGSASNCFRTRAALLEGILEAMLADELPEVEATFSPATADDFVERLVRIFGFLTGPSRTMTAARLALFVESGHDETLRRMLASGRAGLVPFVHKAFADLGAPDPELSTQVLATTFQGLLLHTLGVRAPVDAERVLRVVVESALPAARRPPSSGALRA
jgi:AcrR family transcriptional regulator